ncbi:MAG TPA: magnesium-translocating P-type ATPase [Gemmatimonadaceae bacterium]
MRTPVERTPVEPEAPASRRTPESNARVSVVPRGGGGQAAPNGTAPTPFWSVPIDRLLDELHSSASGLTERDAEERLARLGANAAAPSRRGGALRLFVRQFTNPITALLSVATLLSIAVGEVRDGEIILGILAASGVLGFWQEHRAAGVIARLLALVQFKASVVRDGCVREVPVDAVVPGDVVQLRAGSSVPADARLLAAKDLFVDEAALTGESYPSEKAVGATPADAPVSQRSNAVFLGTHVVSGMASAVVVRTGPATEFGGIAHRLAVRPPETEFERGVRHFGYLLLYIAMVMAIVLFAINVALHRPVLEALLFTLALTVGLTPQLLPAIVSVTLAQGARRMARERVIVRRLASIEDLGGMEILCTDKTGTITEGVVGVHAAQDWTGAASDAVARYAYLNAAFATGFVNPIDEALRAVRPAGTEQYEKADEVPYDFVRKRLSVAVVCGTERLLLTKGALTSVLDICSTAESASGDRCPLAEVRAAIEAQYAVLSRQGYRCLGVAYRALATDAPVTRADECDLTFVGMLSVADPLKPGADDALRELARLHVQVKVISGDSPQVAVRVAEEAGLDASHVLTGGDLHRMTEPALVNAAPRVGVFAEVEPYQKERIIRALEQAGYATGFLGDGINDAAALHAADVGISVDSAADVTKQAADVLLLEKDLRVLARGVREGRQAFANTLKYVFISTSANFGNMFSMAGASLIVAFLPLLPKQILLVNVLSDLPAMAIATDRLDPELVEQPRRWDNRRIRRFMLVFGLVSSVFDYVTFGSLLALGASAAAFRTAWFTESVLSEILILLVIRTRRAFFRSRLGVGLLWGSVTVAVATLVLPFLPFALDLGFTPLPPRLALLMLGIVGVYGLTAEGMKRLFARYVSIG